MSRQFLQGLDREHLVHALGSVLPDGGCKRDVKREREVIIRAARFHNITEIELLYKKRDLRAGLS